MARQNWSRDELVVAFNLYCKTPFGRIHNRNPAIIELATALGRSPSAVSWKLANFARLDPSLQGRAIAGATHGGKLEIEVWQTFSDNWEKLSFESEQLLAKLTHKDLEQAAELDLADFSREGKEREARVKIRVNQNFFRKAVLASYDGCCCLTGLSVPELLNASHIVPWSADASNRVNPRNGLCLNALHDRAFDRGLLTITPNFKVKLSRQMQKGRDSATRSFLLDYEGKTIQLPKRFLPDTHFLEYHNQNIFLG